VLAAAEVLELQSLAHRVKGDDALADYILTIAARTRNHSSLALGVSPRGTQALYRSAQALAMIEGRDYMIADDVKRLVVPAFAHRVVVNARIAMAERGAGAASRILEEILTEVDVPL
jgi:MoxR-like ATPase